jgi:hypothetical protein
VQFIAGATGASPDTVAHAAILTISAVPDILAVLLLLSAGYSKPAAPVEQPKPVEEVEPVRSSGSASAPTAGPQKRDGPPASVTRYEPPEHGQ